MAARVWNRLPREALKAPSRNEFKKHLALGACNERRRKDVAGAFWPRPRDRGETLPTSPLARRATPRGQPGGPGSPEPPERAAGVGAGPGSPRAPRLGRGGGGRGGGSSSAQPRGEPARGGGQVAGRRPGAAPGPGAGGRGVGAALEGPGACLGVCCPAAGRQKRG